ncbi:MAG: ATP-dependent DNA helicase RecG [Candidatus Poseidoniaceae archaeon]|nr:MAG: ATP-dependent DNA helicase RecG [Candidatus Poseidoniaceae archaeon]
MPVLSHPFLRDGIEARGYQIAATQACIRCSTLLVMPTGFGKTAVQWNCMADALDSGIEKIVITAPTVGLVEQQRRMILERIRIDAERVRTYTGSDRPAKRGSIWNEATIIIATPQVIRNDVDSGLIHLNNVGLLIIDEAHHAKGNHATAQVADRYQSQASEPWLVAATASPGSTQNAIRQLRDRLNVNRIFVTKREDDLLKPYAVDMNIATIRVMLDAKSLALIEPLEAHQFEETDALKRQGFLAPTDHLTAGLIEEAAQRASIAISRRDPRGYDAARRISDVRRMHMLLDLLKTQGLRSARSYLERADEQLREGERSTSRFLKKQVVHNFRKTVQGMEECHPKPAYVRQLVQEHLEAHPNERILIFSEYRDTVDHLVYDLNQIPNAIVDRFIGQSKRGKREGMSQKQQLEQLERFRNGDMNVLVATSVGEEGLDVPSASMVLFYEPVSSAIRTIQRRGRTARERSGSVRVLVANDTRDVHVLHASRNREKRMHSVLGRMRLEIPLESYKIRKEGKLLEFSIVEGDVTQPALEFLEQEKVRLKSIEKDSQNASEASMEKQEGVKTVSAPRLHMRSRSQKSLFDFGNDSNDVWDPVLDGRDINRQ